MAFWLFGISWNKRKRGKKEDDDAQTDNLC